MRLVFSSFPESSQILTLAWPHWVSNSDGVLNPSGVRMGSGEIYNVMEKFSDVLDDTLCVGQRRPEDKDERVLLFLKMRPEHKFTPTLEKKIRKEIRTSLSARHVPSFIFEIQDIPVSFFFFFLLIEYI